MVELTGMGAEETLQVLAAQSTRLSRYHRIRIDDPLLSDVIQRAASLKGFFPSKAIALLDAAAVHARLSGVSRVRLEDIYLAAAHFDEEAE